MLLDIFEFKATRQISNYIAICIYAHFRAQRNLQFKKIASSHRTTQFFLRGEVI